VEGDGPTLSQLHDLRTLQGLLETTTPTVSRGQPPTPYDNGQTEAEIIQIIVVKLLRKLNICYIRI